MRLRVVLMSEAASNNLLRYDFLEVLIKFCNVMQYFFCRLVIMGLSKSLYATSVLFLYIYNLCEFFFKYLSLWPPFQYIT